MTDEVEVPDNVDRLVQHLQDGSLAAQLVQAHRATDAAGPADAKKAVLKARLDQVREDLDANEN